ncbi:CPBP family intramembrane glutamic endopeptidase [Brevibacterium gallinarum]|uniref:CPBP family intramembrane metalloprotease n=1 Tax=Brevibacterium gallinarum TaxID=2762220 RepID=A0ABR8WWU5_9MICO|nr:CPBP family intramembrane glutamic endopeptidase [Brevibacterium gallinarum]MBD8021474.1 CPBP family intramembrane metalloprotease [Brevibacterium gallinarum]
MTTPQPASPPRASSADPAFGSWRAIIIFCLLAYGLAWLAVLPLWLNYELFFGTGSPASQLMNADPDNPPTGEAVIAAIVPVLLMSLMMFTPAISALAVMRVVEKVPLRQTFAALGAGPLRTPDGSPAGRIGRLHPALRVLLFSMLAIGIVFVLTILAGLVAMLLGGFEPDWQMTAAREQLEATGLAMPLVLFVLLQIVQVVIAAFVPNGVLGLGEELGWRGYLTAALRRRGVGTVAMIVVSGAIWGAWHAPVLLLGHNFETRSPITIPIMMIGCICVGAVFVWLRETSGSIWPAAIGHGGFNAAAGISILIAADGTWSKPIIANPLGVSGWIVIGAGAVVLFLGTRRGSRLGGAEARSAA